jgi:phosphotransferase system enzyme I (PtsI)
MNGASIPLVKRVVRAASAADGRALLERILELTAADEIDREVRTEMLRRFPGILDEGDTTVGPAGG